MHALRLLAVGIVFLLLLEGIAAVQIYYSVPPYRIAWGKPMPRRGSFQPIDRWYKAIGNRNC